MRTSFCSLGREPRSLTMETANSPNATDSSPYPKDEIYHFEDGTVFLVSHSINDPVLRQPVEQFVWLTCVPDFLGKWDPV